MHTLNITIAVLLGLLASRANAQNLPEGVEIIDRYLEVTGGEEAHARIRSLRITGKVRAPEPMNLEGDYEMLMRAPNSMRNTISLPGLGDIVHVSDGERAWEALSGAARGLTGRELMLTLRAADIHADLKIRRDFGPIESVGVEPFAGEECYRVELTSRTEAPDEVRFYSVETGLMRGRAVEADVGGGRTISQIERLSDYRAFGGVMFPMRTIEDTGGIVLEVIRERIEVNPNLPRDAFDPPGGL